MVASSSAAIAGGTTARAAASSVRASTSMTRGLERSQASAVHSSRSSMPCDALCDLKPRSTALTYARRD
eukprot:scaffold6932_cov28-Tisochrysis_lutea.AAC.3